MNLQRPCLWPAQTAEQWSPLQQSSCSHPHFPAIVAVSEGVCNIKFTHSKHCWMYTSILKSSVLSWNAVNTTAKVRQCALLAQDVFELVGSADGEQQGPGQQRVGVELACLGVDQRTGTIRPRVRPGEQVLKALHCSVYILRQEVVGHDMNICKAAFKKKKKKKHTQDKASQITHE